MESGWKIYSKAKELKLGKTELNMMDFILKEKKMVRDYLYGLTDPNMKEIFLIIILKEVAFINGKTEDDTKDSGTTIKCMAKDCLHGQMESNIMESILMIRKKDMENLNGQVEIYTRGLGKMENNMGKEATARIQNNLNKVFGKMERE